MDSGINLTPKFSDRFFSRFLLGSSWLCVAAATYERRNLCKKWMDPGVM
jgi:hypothetical protein